LTGSFGRYGCVCKLILDLVCATQVRASEGKGAAEPAAATVASSSATDAVKQKNEGKWHFTLLDADDEPPTATAAAAAAAAAVAAADGGDGRRHRGCVVLEVALPRHLDSSLIDVDVHPTWVSLVIKAKVLRLKVCVAARGDAAISIRASYCGNSPCTQPPIISLSSTHTYTPQTQNKNSSPRRCASPRAERSGARRPATSWSSCPRHVRSFLCACGKDGTPRLGNVFRSWPHPTSTPVSPPFPLQVHPKTTLKAARRSQPQAPAPAPAAAAPSAATSSKAGRTSLAEEMLRESTRPLTGLVSVRGIVSHGEEEGDEDEDEGALPPLM
jgi:hypothetical protein